MTLNKKTTRGLTAIGILLLSICTLVNAQTTAKILNTSDNEVVVKIENLQSDQNPTRILLVYDSNLITLESTSNKTNKHRAYYFSVSDKQQYNSANNMMSLLAVDMERDMEVEQWMTRSFNTKASIESLLNEEQEEEIPLEAWMTDLNSW